MNTYQHPRLLFVFALVSLALVWQVLSAKQASASPDGETPDPGCFTMYNNDYFIVFCMTNSERNSGSKVTFLMTDYGEDDSADAFVVGPYTNITYYHDISGSSCSGDNPGSIENKSSSSASSKIDSTIGANHVSCVEVTYFDQAPTVSPSSISRSYNENQGTQVIDVGSSFSDFEGGDLTFSMSGSLSFAPVTLTGGALTIPVTNGSTGSGSVTITGRDSANQSVNMTVSVTVSAVDDPPIVKAPITNMTVAEDSVDIPIDLTTVFQDDAFGGAAMTFSVSANTNASLLNPTVSGNTLTISLLEHQSGSGQITVAAQAGSHTTTDQFDVTVTAVDDPPTLHNPIPSQIYEEDEDKATIDLTDVFTDVDSIITHTVKLNSNPSLMTATINNNALALGFQPDQNGRNTITIEGTADGKKIYDTFFIDVQSVDDAPTVANLIPAVYVDEDASTHNINLSTIFADIDSSTIRQTVTANSGTGLITATIATTDVLQLNFLPDGYHNPTVTEFATITVQGTGVNSSDIGSDQSITTTFDVTIAPIDDLPTLFAPIANANVVEDNPDVTIDLTNVFTDIDTPTNLISYTVDLNSNPTLLQPTITDTQLTLDFQPDQSGTAYLTIQGTYPDQFGLTDPKYIYDTFQILARSVDDPPVVAQPIPAVLTSEDVPTYTIELTDVFTDVDSVTINKTVVGNTDLGVITPTIVNNNILQLAFAPNAYHTPELTASAKITVTGTGVSISDIGGNQAITTSFTVKINPIDDVPILSRPITDVNALEDNPDITLDLTEVFTDIDTPTNLISYTVDLNSNPTLLQPTITGTQLTLDFQPDQFGTAYLTIQGIYPDQFGFTNPKYIYDTFQVFVRSVDDSPVIAIANPIADLHLEEDAPDTLLDVTDVFTDIDSLLITKTVAVLNNQELLTATIDGPNSLRLQYAPEANQIPYQPGVVTSTIILSGTAEGQTATDIFTVHITPTDDYPTVVNPLEPISVLEDALDMTFDFTNRFDDIDHPNEAITITVANSNQSLLNATITDEGASKSLTLDYLHNQFGAASLTVIGHSNGLTTSFTFPITVTAVDDPPYVTQPIPDIQVDEGGVTTAEIDLNNHFSDDDDPNDEIVYRVAINSNPKLVQTQLITETNVLLLNYQTQQGGITYLTIEALSNGKRVENTFAIVVVPQENRPPQTNPDLASTSQGQPVTIDVLANDFDLDDGDIITTHRVISSSHGTAAVNRDSTVTFTPTLSFVGQTSLLYEVVDIYNMPATSTVTIDVIPAAVTNLTAQQITDVPLQIQLDWTAPFSDTISHYELIMRSPTTTETVTLTETTYIDQRSSLTYETTYQYGVQAWRDGLPAPVTEVSVTTTAPPEVAPQITGSGTIAGQVVATRVTNGSTATVPIAEAIVCVTWQGVSAEGTDLCQQTQADGSFVMSNLITDVWHLKVSPPIMGEFATYLPSETQIIDLRTQAEQTDLQITLNRPNVTGRLVLGTPNAQARQTGESNLGGVILQVQQLDSNQQVDLTADVWWAASDAEGRFSFGTIPVGSYRVTIIELPAAYSSYYIPKPTIFTVDNAVTQVALGDLVIPKTLKTVSGRVTLPNNSGPNHVMIEAVNVDTGETKTIPVNSDGSYEIFLARGTWELAPVPAPGQASNSSYLGLPQRITFNQPNATEESETFDFPVVAVDSAINGQVVTPDGDPLLSANGTIQVKNLESEAITSQNLNQDGLFNIPVLAGEYELSVWLDQTAHPLLGVPEPRQISAIADQTTEQQITLIDRDKQISGQVVDEVGEPARFITITVRNQQNEWFSTRTDADGAYNIALASGQWTIWPLSPADEARYVYENDDVTLSLSDNNRQQTVDFVVTGADQRIAGRFVDESERLVELGAQVILFREGQAIANTSVEFGQFDLPWPNTCADTCVVQATLNPNAVHSLLVSDQQDAAETIEFVVAENNGVIEGQFLDPLTGESVTGLEGELRLTPIGDQADLVTGQVTTIRADGTYQFTQLGPGEFELSYELFVQLDHEAFFNNPDNALSKQRYLKKPSANFVVEADSSASIVHDVVLETGNTFLVTVESEPFETVTAYYPTTIRCEYEDGRTTTYTCDKGCFGPSWMSTCATPSLEPINETFADQITALVNTARPTRCVVQVAPSLAAPDFAPPSAQPIALDSQDLVLFSRRRDLTIQGQVVTSDSTVPDEGQVTVSIYSGGNDGQLYTTQTDANGAYQFEVSSTDQAWSIKAETDYAGTLHQATTTLTEATPNAEGVVEVATLQLASTGQPAVAANNSFNQSDGGAFSIPVGPVGPNSTQRQAETTQTLQVTVPPGALDELGSSEVGLTIDTVSVPENGTTYVIGNGYRIRLVDAGRNLRLLSPLRQPILVDLPYNQADLDALNVSADQLQAAYFSPAQNLWTPFQSTVDANNQQVQLALSQPVEAVALLAPKTDGAQFFNPFIVPTSGVVNVSPSAGMKLSIMANTFRNQVVVSYAPLESVESGLGYSLTATDVTGAVVQPRPSQPYTVSIQLDDFGFTPSESTTLYYRDDAGAWQPEASSRLNAEQTVLTANPTRFGSWAVAVGPVQESENKRLYLPLLTR